MKRTAYKFTIRHSSQIDWGKIAGDLDYNKPLAVVQYGDVIRVSVHVSIPRKSNLVKIANPLPNKIMYGLEVTLDELKMIKDWIAAVKKAKWPEPHFKGGCTVTVTNPVFED